MGEQKARALLKQRVGDDGADRQVCLAFEAIVPGQVNAIEFAVHMRNPQTLSSRIGLREASGEKRLSRFGSVQLERLFGTLIAHLD